MARKRKADELTADNGAVPAFDFSTYSHREAREMQMEIKRLRRLDGLTNDPDAYDDEEAFEDALTQINELVDVIEGYICRVLVSVPPDWLLPDAPAGLDWSQPASLGWLIAVRYNDLQDMMLEARRPENVSKNSARH